MVDFITLTKDWISSSPGAELQCSILLNVMNYQLPYMTSFSSSPGGPVWLVHWLFPSILKMVMKKMNEAGKSYCHFYYLLLKDHVFLSPQTVGSSAVYTVFGERPWRWVEYNQKTTQRVIKPHHHHREMCCLCRAAPFCSAEFRGNFPQTLTLLQILVTTLVTLANCRPGHKVYQHIIGIISLRSFEAREYLCEYISVM